VRHKTARRELCRIIRHLGSGISRKGSKHTLRLFEIARVFVRFDHVARVVINASAGPMWVTPTAHDEILPEKVRLISWTLRSSAIESGATRFCATRMRSSSLV
jgi:hypothetical protein